MFHFIHSGASFPVDLGLCEVSGDELGLRSVLGLMPMRNRTGSQPDPVKLHIFWISTGLVAVLIVIGLSSLSSLTLSSPSS